MPPDVVQLRNAPALSWDDCRLLVDSVVDEAIFMVTPEGRVATWNLGAERITGYGADEIVGEHFSRLFLAEDVEAERPAGELQQAANEGRFEDESWRVRKDGTRFWANVVITALRDEHGQLRGFGQVTRDLTARRAIEAELRQAEQRFHQLVDAVIDDAIVMLDPNGNVATWNSGAHRLKGYTADEIMGKRFSVFYTPEDRTAGKPERSLVAARQAGRFEDEGWRVRKDGSRFWAKVAITSLEDETGKLMGFAKVTRDLTERRQAEENLRRTEERFRLLVDNVGDYAIYMLDPEGRVTTWNLGAERMKGYTAGEIIGQSFSRFFPEEDAKAGKPAREIAEARAQGRFEDEGWRVRKDGTRFWANAILTSLRSAQGELVGFAKITRDLTPMKEKERAERRVLTEQAAREAAEAGERRVRESEERYRALSRRFEIVLEGVADGITVQDRTGRVVYANTAAARSCGFKTGAELVATPPTEIVARFEVRDSDGEPFPIEKFPARRVLAGEEGSGAVLQVRERASAREWWVLIRSSAVLDEQGAPDLAITIWHDVTAERQKDRNARYLAELTAALGGSLDTDEMLGRLAGSLVPGLADWCSVYLVEGACLRNVTTAHSDPAKARASAEYQRRFPPSPDHAGRVWAVLRSGTAEVFNDITPEILLGATNDPEAVAFLGSLGMRAAAIVPLRVRDRVLGAVTLISTSSRRRFEASDLALFEELGRRAGVAIDNARLYKAAQASAKAAEEASRAKDEFLATVSHELRTPLNAVLGWAAMLRHRPVDASIAKPIEVIYRNSQAQAKIIEDILDVSRIITGKLRIEPKPMDLVAIARDTIEVVRPSADAKRLRIEFEAETEVCLIVADGERIQQVAWNLLSNAIKFTDAGVIKVAVRQEGSKFTLTVSDTGKGIPPEFMPFVFDRFRQADSSITRRMGGRGLGLALVRHIIELHGGRVAVTSDGPGTGATFKVTLPVRAIMPPQPTPVPEPVARPQATAAPTLTGIRVLVVDDEPDARDLLQAVLVEGGALVAAARSGAEGLEELRRFRPDVLVSDIGMPDEDGYAFLRKVRALPPGEGGAVPAIALTAYAREEDRMRAIAAGYMTHLAKPVDPDAFLYAVGNVVSATRST
ncbi:MAG TPA: PAS domain S-box protein [Polyangiaceae bacterium]